MKFLDFNAPLTALGLGGGGGEKEEGGEEEMERECYCTKMKVETPKMNTLSG